MTGAICAASDQVEFVISRSYGGFMDNKHSITVTIQSGRGSKEFTFPQQTKVVEAATQAAIALGYPSGDKYALVREKDGQELSGDRTLVSYDIEDGEKLTLTVTGTGA